MSITRHELRSKYLEFFVGKHHVAIESASLVPARDPTVLFTTAGMHPLVPYLLGEPHPSGSRLVGIQKCVRTGDIDAIGDATHLTFFEMLGNWSLGDYFRDDAIRWSFEFLTDPRWLGLAIERLGMTCFAGDDRSARDDDSAQLWTSLGVPGDRIQFLGRDDNWWGPVGESGPCGPDTEIFYWVGNEPPPRVLDVSDSRWVEIWNNVFMTYTQRADGTLEPLARANVDTGMGLERTLVALNGWRSVYDVETIAPIVDELRRMGGTEHDSRVIADHMRAACMLICDGVVPSNKDRGYVVRRLIRRSLVLAQRLGLPGDWSRRVTACIAHVQGDAALQRELDRIEHTIALEISRFERTLAQGLRMLGKQPNLDGQVAFDLFQTYGFPFELTCELALAAGKSIDRASFAEALERHRNRSRGRP